MAMALALLTIPRALRAADFPPITEEEKALKSVAGAPNAPAAILFHNGEFQMLDLAQHEVSSRLTVQNRVKILTEEGKSQGEIEIEHSADVRLSGFAGRTVLPDGTVVPVPADAKFVRRLSKNRKLYVTAVAFPAVQPGAILDYRYDLHFDSIFFLSPWFFASRLPVLHSEITYLIPGSLGIQTWSRDPYGVGIKSEKTGTVRGNKLKTWADRIPPVPDEPWSFPFEDLAAQVTVIPTAVSLGGNPERLLESWATTSELLLEYYDKALGSHGDAKRKARELTAALGSKAGQRQQAEALYRFVRDEVPNDDSTAGVVVGSESPVDGVLKKGGDSAMKALLLLSMLDTVKIKAKPVWAAGHDSGTVDLRLANPHWFDRVLVAAEIDGTRVFLDPSEPHLGFGRLPAELEGTTALIPDRKKPEPLVLPESPAERNLRRAEVKLAVDDKGALAGSGTLRLSGHHAAARIGWKEDAAKTAAAWKEWLEKAYKEFAISDVQVAETPEEPKVEVRWAMAERPEEVLGDQATLLPSRPLGPTAQPFKVSIAKRGAPIFFDYANRNEVELALTWPAGWSPGALPKAVRQESDAGVFTSEVEVKEAERTLVFRRRMDVTARLFLKSDHCERLRTLFDAAEKSDASGLVLVRRK